MTEVPEQANATIANVYHVAGIFLNTLPVFSSLSLCTNPMIKVML